MGGCSFIISASQSLGPSERLRPCFETPVVHHPLGDMQTCTEGSQQTAMAYKHQCPARHLGHSLGEIIIQRAGLQCLCMLEPSPITIYGQFSLLPTESLPHSEPAHSSCAHSELPGSYACQPHQPSTLPAGQQCSNVPTVIQTVALPTRESSIQLPTCSTFGYPCPSLPPAKPSCH
jgi:hypothetical protein